MKELGGEDTPLRGKPWTLQKCLLPCGVCRGGVFAPLHPRKVQSTGDLDHFALGRQELDVARLANSVVDSLLSRFGLSLSQIWLVCYRPTS